MVSEKSVKRRFRRYSIGNQIGAKKQGRLINRPTQTGRRTCDKFLVYIPTELARDSAFPFRPGDEVEVEIDVEGKRLLIGHAPTNSAMKGRRPRKTP